MTEQPELLDVSKIRINGLSYDEILIMQRWFDDRAFTSIVKDQALAKRRLQAEKVKSDALYHTLKDLVQQFSALAARQEILICDAGDELLSGQGRPEVAQQLWDEATLFDINEVLNFSTAIALLDSIDNGKI